MTSWQKLKNINFFPKLQERIEVTKVVVGKTEKNFIRTVGHCKQKLFSNGITRKNKVKEIFRGCVFLSDFLRRRFFLIRI